MSRQLSGVLEINQIIAKVVKQTTTLLRAERATLFVLDKEKGILWSRVAHGIDAIKVPMDKGLVGHAVATRSAINIADAYEDSRFNKSVDMKTGFRTKAVLVMPIISEASDELVGALQVMNKDDGGEFDEEDLRFLTEFSKQIGVALSNAFTYNASKSEIDKSAKNLRFLNTQIKSMQDRLSEERQESSLKERRTKLFMEVSKSLMMTSTLDDIFEEVIGNIKQLLNTDRATFFLHDNQSNELYAHIVDENSDVDQKKLKEIRIGVDTGIIGYTFQTKEILNIPDAYEDARFDKSVDARTGYRTVNLLSVPVYDKRGKVIGVVEAINKFGKSPGTFQSFNELDVNSLVDFASQISIALCNCAQYEVMTRMSEKASSSSLKLKEEVASITQKLVNTEMESREHLELLKLSVQLAKAEKRRDLCMLIDQSGKNLMKNVKFCLCIVDKNPELEVNEVVTWCRRDSKDVKRSILGKLREKTSHRYSHVETDQMLTQEQLQSLPIRQQQ